MLPRLIPSSIKGTAPDRRITGTVRRRGLSLLLEVILGLSIVLLVILLVASLFPGSYQASLQAARMDSAIKLSQQVLERQKRLGNPVPIANQSIEYPITVQGRPVVAKFTYRVDRESATGTRPVLWKTTVEWENAGKPKQIYLVGASPQR